jgi:hypothetical protein
VRRSLASNTVQHARILEVCENALREGAKDAAIVLREVITRVKPDRWGGLSEAGRYPAQDWCKPGPMH